MRRFPAPALALFISFAAFVSEPAASLAVTLEPGSYLEAVASPAGTLEAIDRHDLVGLPTVDSAAVLVGGNQSACDFDLSNGGFYFEFDHARDIAQGAFASTRGSIFFSVDEDVDYTLSGTYSAMDADGRRIEQSVSISDETEHATVAIFHQQSAASPNESFTLGLQEGDRSNAALGSLSGTLLAGRLYRLSFIMTIQAVPTGASAGATAEGDLDVAFAPEPSTLLLRIAALGSLWALCRLGSFGSQAALRRQEHVEAQR